MFFHVFSDLQWRSEAVKKRAKDCISISRKIKIVFRRKIKGRPTANINTSERLVCSKISHLFSVLYHSKNILDYREQIKIDYLLRDKRKARQMQNPPKSFSVESTQIRKS